MPEWFPVLLKQIGENPELAEDYWEEMERDIEDMKESGLWEIHSTEYRTPCLS